MEYIQYNPTSVYISSSNQHAPAQGQIGWGAKVKFLDNSVGTVWASNQEKTLVDYGSGIEWFDNSLLRIRSDFIQE